MYPLQHTTGPELGLFKEKLESLFQRSLYMYKVFIQAPNVMCFLTPLKGFIFFYLFSVTFKTLSKGMQIT